METCGEQLGLFIILFVNSSGYFFFMLQVMPMPRENVVEKNKSILG